MNFSKRIFVYIFIILLIASVYKDLSLGIDSNISTPTETTYVNNNYSIIKKKVSPGDTVLSIVEELSDINQIKMDDILSDFEQLNPNVDPYSIQPNNYYYFPSYKMP